MTWHTHTPCDVPAGLCRTALQAAKKAAIHTLLEQLEQINPQPHPLDHEDMLAGDWRLLYSTITITVCCWGEGEDVWLEGGEETRRCDFSPCLLHGWYAGMGRRHVAGKGGSPLQCAPAGW